MESQPICVPRNPEGHIRCGNVVVVGACVVVVVVVVVVGGLVNTVITVYVLNSD